MAYQRRIPTSGPAYEAAIAGFANYPDRIEKINEYKSAIRKYNEQMSDREGIAKFWGGADYVDATPEQVSSFKAKSLDEYIKAGKLPPEVVQYVRDDIMSQRAATGILNGMTEVNVPGLGEPLHVQLTNGNLGNIGVQRIANGQPYFVDFYETSGKLKEQGYVPVQQGGILNDLGPLALAAVGANFLAPAAGAAGGAAAGGAGASLSPYAAQAAGAYGGSAAAAQAAAAGSLAGIQTASAAQNALNLGIPTGGGAVPNQVAGMSTDQISPLTPEVAGNADKAALYGAEGYGAAATPAELAAAAGGTGLLSSLGDVGTAILDFAKANPSIAGSLLGAVTGAIGAANAPKAATTQTNIDPELKREYLANIERAKQTAADLGVRQFAEPGAMYTGAEQKLYNLGMTPFGAEDIARFYNPYQEQVVQGALGDIERTRQMQEQANMEQATRARAFGGSRQGVVSGMTNEAALRQAATTGAQLRSAGFNTAANLGMAARPLDIAGLQTSLNLGTARTALEQARLDALRNLGTERLAITSGSLGIGIPNIGGSTSQPLYSNVAGSALSGGLTGSYIGSLLDPNRNKRPVS
jgi:hypothetical protein